MPHTKSSLFVQRMYRQYVQPLLPQYEPETYILRSLKFDRCVDVGAHAGTYSILLSHNSEHVYAFEPTRHSFDILKALNIPNLTAYNLALGSDTGETDFCSRRRRKHRFCPGDAAASDKKRI